MESSLSTGDMGNTNNTLLPPVGGDPNYKWKVLVSVIFGTFMVILDSTAVNVAIPTLQREFKAPIDQVDGSLNDSASSVSILRHWVFSYLVQSSVRSRPHYLF